MNTWLFIDISLHFLLSSLYSTYFLKRHSWSKNYYFCSFIIFSLGTLIDLDHRNVIGFILEKIGLSHLMFEIPPKLFHICHTAKFAIVLLIACVIVFILGYRDFSLLSFASYSTHMLIDSIKKPGLNPNNILPAQIHKFLWNR